MSYDEDFDESVLEGDLLSEDDEDNHEITLHDAQSEVFRALMTEYTCRYAVACCSRGFGKSYLALSVAMTAVEELLNLHERVPNKKVYIIAPTHDQVKDIYMPLLIHDYGVEDFAIKVLQDKGYVEFENGVQLILLSYESVERIRGKGRHCSFKIPLIRWNT